MEKERERAREMRDGEAETVRVMVQFLMDSEAKSGMAFFVGGEVDRSSSQNSRRTTVMSFGNLQFFF